MVEKAAGGPELALIDLSAPSKFSGLAMSRQEAKAHKITRMKL
jgi:hypothetical protein